MAKIANIYGTNRSKRIGSPRSGGTAGIECRAESLDEMSESGWNAPDTAAGPEESAENKELKRAISAAIDTLPVDIRTAVVLRDIQGFSYEDVSQIMNINIGTVKSRISRGRERLRELLSEYREQK